MDVERLAEQIDRHRRALEVPPRPAPSPRGIPGGADLLVFRLRRLPEGEVARVLLRVVVLRYSSAGDHLATVKL
jgi:hypothetical protein